MGPQFGGAAAPTHTKRIQIIQNKILRIIANAPWYVRNSVIHHDLHMEPIDNYITRTSRNVFPPQGSPPLDCPVSIVPHKSLNSCRGVISEPDLLTTTDAEILDGFSDQGVIQSLQLLNHLHQLKQNSYPPHLLLLLHRLQNLYLPNSVIDTAPTTSNSLSISAASSSSTACSVLETTTTTSTVSTENLPVSVLNDSNNDHSNAAEAQQIVKRKSRNRRKRSKIPKPDIEIKKVPHSYRNATPTEITTDDEDMITYDVEEEELEQDPFFISS
ncbi:hypothetical protein TNCV_3082541 [Trichonephila clavipes]|nr:hypothetical protein TNCV_3082541 [Trichonephila clavipes]